MRGLILKAVALVLVMGVVANADTPTDLSHKLAEEIKRQEEAALARAGKEIDANEAQANYDKLVEIYKKEEDPQARKTAINELAQQAAIMSLKTGDVTPLKFFAKKGADFNRVADKNGNTLFINVVHAAYNICADTKISEDQKVRVLNSLLGGATKDPKTGKDFGTLDWLLAYGGDPDKENNNKQSAFKLLSQLGGPSAGKKKDAVDLVKPYTGKGFTPLDHLQRRLTRSLSDLQGTESENLDLRETVKNLKTDVANLQDSLAKVNEAKRLLGVDHDNLKAAKATIDKEHATLKAAKAQLDTDFATLRGIKDKLDLDYNALKTTHGEFKDAKTKLDVAYAALTMTKNKLQEDYNTLSQSDAKLQGDHRTLKTAKEKLDADYLTLKMAKEKLDADHLTLKTAKEKLDADHLTLKTAKERFDADYRTLMAAKNTADRANEALMAENKTLKEENAKKKDEKTGDNQLLEIWTAQMTSGLCSEVLDVARSENKHNDAKDKEADSCKARLQMYIQARPMNEAVSRILLRWEGVMHGVCNTVITKEDREVFSNAERPRDKSSERLKACALAMEKATNPKSEKTKFPLLDLMTKASEALALVPKGESKVKAEPMGKPVQEMACAPVYRREGVTHGGVSRVEASRASVQ